MRNNIFLTYSGHILKVFPHHISVERLLGWIQQSPFLHGEFHSHILKGHYFLSNQKYIFRKNSKTYNTKPQIRLQEIEMSLFNKWLLHVVVIKHLVYISTHVSHMNFMLDANVLLKKHQNGNTGSPAI